MGNGCSLSREASLAETWVGMRMTAAAAGVLFLILLQLQDSSHFLTATADIGHQCGAAPSASMSHEDEVSGVSYDPCTALEAEVHKDGESTTGKKEGEPSSDVPISVLDLNIETDPEPKDKISTNLRTAG